MTELWFYEINLVGNSLVREKFLMVIDENHVAKAKYNLTAMGLEHVNTLDELKQQVWGLDAYKLED